MNPVKEQEPAHLDHGDVQRYYDTEYYRDARLTGRPPWHMRRIANRLGLSPGQQVLDVACGTGAWLFELRGRGAKVAGVELSPAAAELCRQAMPDADVRVAPAEHLPFADASFDLVSCLGSLEHFLDQPAALREMLRVARPGAQFLILVPNAGFLTRRLGVYGGTQQVAIRETVRALSEWQQMFESVGLTVKARWKDLHMLNRGWLFQGRAIRMPLRWLQALALPLWPLAWQYQVYFLCERR